MRTHFYLTRRARFAILQALSTPADPTILSIDEIVSLAQMFSQGQISEAGLGMFVRDAVVRRVVSALPRQSPVRRDRRGGRGAQGFASMDKEKQREIASKGGRAAHQQGTGHEWTSDEARAAASVSVSRRRSTMKTVTAVAVLICVVCAGSVQAQTPDPCLGAAGGLQLNPTTVRFKAPGHMVTMPGSPTAFATTEYQVGVFVDGVDPNTGAPRTSIVVPRSQVTAVPGVADCYVATPSELLAIPVAERFRGAIKSRRSGIDSAESAWSPLSLDPFMRPAAPPAAVTGVRIFTP